MSLPAGQGATMPNQPLDLDLDLMRQVLDSLEEARLAVLITTRGGIELDGYISVLRNDVVRITEILDDYPGQPRSWWVRIADVEAVQETGEHV